jgi:hypothetical protein
LIEKIKIVDFYQLTGDFPPNSGHLLTHYHQVSPF